MPNCEKNEHDPHSCSRYDILITANPTQLIGEIAHHLCYSDVANTVSNAANDGDGKQKPISGATICVIDGDKRIILRPHQYLRDSILVDGMTIGIMPHIFDHAYSYADKVVGAFTDQTTQKTYPLYQNNYFGRAFGNDLQTGEREISRNHCIVHIKVNDDNADDDAVQIEDLGAKNPARLVNECEDNSSITQNLATNTELIDKISNSKFTMQIESHKYLIELFPTYETSDLITKHLGINEKILAKYQQKWIGRGYLIPSPPEGKGFKSPKKNKPPKPQPLNIVSMLIPLVLGGILYFVMPNPMTVMFLMMSPLMILGNWIFSKLRFRREKRDDLQKFERKLTKVQDELQSSEKNYLDIMRLRHPPLEQINLWQKHKSDSDYYNIRIGEGGIDTNITYDDKLILVDNAPVTVNINDGLSICNINGGTEHINALLTMLISLYSYAELEIGIVANTEYEIDAFEWLKWTNHLSPELMCNNAASQQLLLEKLQNRKDNSKMAVIIITNILPENYGILERLVELGKEQKVFYVWLGGLNDKISRTAKTLIYYSKSPYYIERGPELARKHYFEPSPPPSRNICEMTAKTMLNYRDLSEIVTENDRIPKEFLFENLLDYDPTVFSEQILKTWAKNEQNITKTSPLKCAIGMSGKKLFTVDLRANGPHALIGGTTGAGKSEFLQSWITSLALTSSPYRVNFLLVDYKGGSAFAKCSQFPHTVGMITDLDPHLTKRVTNSLHAELVRRELLLKEHNAKDISALEAKDKQCPLANLVIVIDEFAALAKEMPDFVDEIVDIAARGRSLGIHLIMATQRPSGVIKDNIKANTNLRIALRVTNPSESNEIIGIKDAASIAENIPGRFYAAFGGSAPVEVQSAYIGYTAHKQEQNIDIQNFRLNTLINTSIHPHKYEQEPKPNIIADADSTFLSKVTKSIQYSYMELAYNMNNANGASIHVPWQEPLQTVIPFKWHTPTTESGVRPGENFGAVLGVSYIAKLDDIHNCAQPEISATELLGSDNILITGKSGSGKTNALEVIIAGLISDSARMNNYLITCASTDSKLSDNNHLQIIDANNTELLYRLLKLIHDGYSKDSNAKTLLFIDRIDGLKELLENSELQLIGLLWNKLLANCNAYNVQIVATQGRIGGIYQNWQSYFGKQIYLELSLESEYNIASIKSTEIIHKWPSGRALTTIDNIRYEMQFYYLENNVELPSLSAVEDVDKQDCSNTLYTQPKIGVLGTNYTYSKDILGYSSNTLNAISNDSLQNINGMIFIIGKNSCGKTSVASLLSNILETNVYELPNNPTESDINRIIDSNEKVIVTVPYSGIQGNWNLLNLIRKSDCVILLNINHNEASSILPTDLPTVDFVPQSPGRGYMILRNDSYHLQFCNL